MNVSSSYVPTYAPAPTINASNNRISGTTFSYDNTGNLTQAAVAPGGATQTFGYDAENKLVNFNNGTASYSYDGDGHRVKKTVGSSTTVFVYDAMGKLIAEYSNTAATGSGTKYITADHLGSTRLITDASGNVLARHDYLPFGEEIPTLFGSRSSVTGYNNSDDTKQKFTGKERDSESNLDNFGARYFGSSMGRFTSPDSPSYSNHKNPQSWNLYAYSLNNPVTLRDADGHRVYCVGNTQQCKTDAAAATGNAKAASRVTTQTTTTEHKFLFFHWKTTETQIAIRGDVNTFRALSPNAAKLADLVSSDKTVTVNYTDVKSGTWRENGEILHGGSTSRTPSQGWDPTAWIDPNRTQGAVYDPDAVAQGIPQANTAEEFGHEVLGHIWGELFGGAPAGTRANMRDSIIGENAVRALDPTRGQKGIESHHNYNEMPPDPPK